MKRPLARCATCNQPRAGRYCAHCGEKGLGPEDHTLRHFFGHLFMAFTNADGKIFLTLRLLFTRPGRLTADHVRGRRKPYIPPLQAFLISNLVFFLLHPLVGSNILTTDLNTNLHYAWYHGVAEAMVGPRLAARGVTVDTYARVFDPAAVTQAKSLVILVVPIFSLAVLALYGRHRRPYVAHLVYSLHFCAFWLLFVCASLALTNGAVRLLRATRVFPSAAMMGASMLVLNLLIMTLYLFHAGRAAFHREKSWVTGAKAFALAIAFDLSLEVYRFVLFFITFWST